MMSSSDGTGAVGEAVAAESAVAAVPAAGGDDPELADPWFTPGPKVGPADAAGVEATGDGAQAEWFLPAGRAGLQPDSMTVSWDDESGLRDDRAGRAESAGAPPWAGDSAAAADGEPPPWENGPWPGPGEAQDRPSAAPATAAQPDDSDPDRPAGPRLRSARVVLAASAVAVALVVIIVVIVTSTSGGPTGGCATYPSAVRQAYARAMSDLRSGRAPASVQAASLGQAASRANAAAAAAGQISARTALFTMASDLDEAHADVIAHRPVSADLLQRLTADRTALPASC